MKILSAPLLEFSWYRELRDRMLQKKFNIALSGCEDSQKIHMMSSLASSQDVVLIVTYDETKAREICEEYAFYDRNVQYYPAKDLIFYQSDLNGNQLAINRMMVVKKLMEMGDGAVEGKMTIVTTIEALMTPMLPLEVIRSNSMTLGKGSIADERAVAIKLTRMGYEKTYQVENKGEFSIRGGIIDIFDLTQDNPVRIELWGDEVESIRSFDVLSQRSIEELEQVTIFPGNEMILSEDCRQEGFAKIEKEAKEVEKIFRDSFKTEEAHRIAVQLEELRTQLMESDMMLNLESYIKYFYPDATTFLRLLSKCCEKWVIYLDEPAHVRERADAIELEFRESMMHRLEKGLVLKGQTNLLTGVEETLAEIKNGRSIAITAIPLQEKNPDYDENYYVKSRSLSSYNGSVSLLVEDLKKLKRNGYRVVILSPSRTRANRLADDLLKEEIVASYTDNENRKLQPGEIVTFYGRIKKGFEYPDLKFVVIAETDIFGPEKKHSRKKRKFSTGQKIKDYTMLKVGDYVIHENHGVGIYKGIEKVEVDHILKDFMKIEYRDKGVLYVLPTNLETISLYADRDAKQPKLNKLGSQEWNKTKGKVKCAVDDMAKELVQLYAARMSRTGYQYGQDTSWQREFEEMFPYEETEDQLNAIEATKDDMESTKIMDRLICGDVGYGKTEIAIRAAFKAVQDGKQVAYLVPTTILAQQHYNNFKERMKNYPVSIALLSRFCTSRDIKQTLTDMKNGRVDIVIGTHRLLSKDVIFKELGLLVIDEEQRFGVGHKEKIKQMKENVDVLTLTATPIPRTLNMSLIGVRDMSILEEAPQDRLPIQTYVMEYNEEMVREAINRELARNGQVYYVYNRVDGIEDIAGKVAALVPNARVAFAHGQMNPVQLESLMMDFINHDIDVLVATTIIETGLDIPNVNTMIIHDSDSLGLSQLYQLRGRVGRSNRTSYAFLMYRRNKVLKEVAEKRLAAIKEFTDLGSGFKIAMRDLEIRGCGDILGKQQHGHMQAVGYDLYCKMLEEAVRTQKGEEMQVSERSTLVDLNVDAYLPPEYVVNEEQKLDLYKKISSIYETAEIDDLRDELRDRFGNVPRQAENLLRIAAIKIQAREKYVTEIKGTVGRIKFIMQNDAPVKVDEIMVFLNEFGGQMSIAKTADPTFIYKYDIIGLVEKDEQLLIAKTEEVLEKMQILYGDGE